LFYSDARIDTIDMTEQHVGSILDEQSEPPVVGAAKATHPDAGLKCEQMQGSEPRNDDGDVLKGVVEQTAQKGADEEEDSIDGIDDDDETETTAADDLAIAAASLSGVIDSAPNTAVEKKNPSSRMSLKQVAAALEAPPGKISDKTSQRISYALSMKMCFCLL
jgi:hypothetical protein